MACGRLDDHVVVIPEKNKAIYLDLVATHTLGKNAADGRVDLCGGTHQKASLQSTVGHKVNGIRLKHAYRSSHGGGVHHTRRVNTTRLTFSRRP